MQKSEFPKVAQIGCGYWGKNLARNFWEIGSLAAICDSNVDPELVAKFEVPVRELDDLLADDTITAFSIATPAETHYEIALKAIDNGKHVFIEKPITLDAYEGQKLLDAAAAKNCILMVGHLIHYHPVFARLKALVSEGKVGKLQYIYSNRLSMGKFRNTEDVMWSFAPHDVSMMQSITGEEPDKLVAVGKRLVSENLYDLCHLHATFSNGVKGHIQTSWYHYRKAHKFVAIGEEGTLVFEDSEPEWSKKLAFFPHTIDRSGPVPVPVKGEQVYIEVEQSEPLRNECLHFLECIKDGKSPLTDGQEGLSVLKTLKRTEQSMREGGF